MAINYKIVTCAICEGQGLIKTARIPTDENSSLPGYIQQYGECSSCGGIGYVKINPNKLNKIKYPD